MLIKQIFLLRAYFLIPASFVITFSMLSCYVDRKLTEILAMSGISRNIVVDSIPITLKGNYTETFYIINDDAQLEAQLKDRDFHYIGSKFGYHFFHFYLKLEDRKNYVYSLAFQKDEVTVFDEFTEDSLYIHANYRNLIFVDGKKYVLGHGFYNQISGKYINSYSYISKEYIERKKSLFLEYARKWIANPDDMQADRSLKVYNRNRDFITVRLISKTTGKQVGTRCEISPHSNSDCLWEIPIDFWKTAINREKGLVMQVFPRDYNNNRFFYDDGVLDQMMPLKEWDIPDWEYVESIGGKFYYP